MTLSASDMGIRDGLDPFFCSDCGERLGWIESGEVVGVIYCEDCAKKQKTYELTCPKCDAGFEVDEYNTGPPPFTVECPECGAEVKEDG